MPILAVGNPDARKLTSLVDRVALRSTRVRGEAAQRSEVMQQNALSPGLPRRAIGFTLLELLVVLAIVAIASAGVGFALRDDTQVRLEREALRLGALLEAARAQSQVSGVATRWLVTAQGFRFEPEVATGNDASARAWLDGDTRARVEANATTPANVLLLGPDAILLPQTVTLFSARQADKRVPLATDGVRPFAVRQEAP